MSIHDRDECEYCDGDGELSTSGLSICTHVSRTNKAIASMFNAAWIALDLVHKYRAECCARGDQWRADHRIVACMERVASYRSVIKSLRASCRGTLGHLAWCLKCKGTGLANIECEGCGGDVDMFTRNDEALEYANVLVHKGCDTGNSFFDHEPSHDRAVGVWQ